MDLCSQGSHTLLSALPLLCWAILIILSFNPCKWSLGGRWSLHGSRRGVFSMWSAVYSHRMFVMACEHRIQVCRCCMGVQQDWMPVRMSRAYRASQSTDILGSHACRWNQELLRMQEGGNGFVRNMHNQEIYVSQLRVRKMTWKGGKSLDNVLLLVFLSSFLTHQWVLSGDC